MIDDDSASLGYGETRGFVKIENGWVWYRNPSVLKPAMYEFKCVCRNIFLGIFTILSFVGLVIYPFIPTEANSVHNLFRFSMDRISQVFPSSLAYKTAYFFNCFLLSASLLSVHI